jgi:hypothetical protein
MLIRAQLSLFRKIQLIILFSLDGFICIATICRHVAIFRNIYDSNNAAMWAIRETGVAIIVNNAPLIKALLDKCIRKTQTQLTGLNPRSSGARGGTGSHLELVSTSCRILGPGTVYKESNRQKESDLEIGRYHGDASTERVIHMTDVLNTRVCDSSGHL